MRLETAPGEYGDWMQSELEVRRDLELIPWFRYNRYWPDENLCELIWLLAHAMLAIHTACLVGNPAPVVQEMYERMTHPQVGDLVLETTTRGAPTWPERALGRLLAIREDSYHGKIYDVASLYFEDRAVTHWENSSFIALPVDEQDYLNKGGSVVFTRSSLMAALGSSGFELKENA